MYFILTVFFCALFLLILIRFSKNPIIALIILVLTLAIKIPLTILTHVKFLLFKNERIPPTLFQRISSVFTKTMVTIPLPLLRQIVNSGTKGHEQQKNWVKKLDASFKHDGWEGYLIANDAEQSEIGKDADMILLYVHGGAFVNSNPLVPLEMLTSFIKTWKLNHGVNTQVLALEYRLSPEYSFPTARDNVLACYNWLVTQKKISPSKIAIAGDSTGGNLAIVSAIYLLNNPDIYSIDLPASIILISPFLSAKANTKSYIENDSYDNIDANWLLDCVDLYIGNSNLSPTNPSISPLFENQLSGLPKVWACVGSYEVFLDDVKAFVEKLSKNNVPAELVIEEVNAHNYLTIKETSRNGGRENSINQLGKFLYGEGKKAV